LIRLQYRLEDRITLDTCCRKSAIQPVHHPDRGLNCHSFVCFCARVILSGRVLSLFSVPLYLTLCEFEGILISIIL
jgi:hypothetical protein